jgi:two-component system, NarL family, nitrate/nitrite response regulator NarL
MTAGKTGTRTEAVGIGPGRGRRRVRVVAADRHPLYRDAIARAIKERPELELVGQAGDGREALDAIGAERPDVAVIDRSLGELTGDQVLNAVRRDGLGTRVILIAAEPPPKHVYAAIASGAAGYLTTDTDARQLCEAISAVARGRTVLAPELQAGIAGEIRLREVRERPILSDRERETVKLVAQGLSAPDIGKRLHLSTGTVKTHLQHLYEKLGVSERAAAVAEAMRRGLLE